jgi:Domain of unknown function (DUF5615)
VKFLIDRCAGHRLAEWLRAQGHDVVESRERGPDPGDRVLLEWAGAEDRILVTRVAQSGYCHREGRANPGVPRFVNTYLRSIGRVVGVRRAHPNLPCLHATAARRVSCCLPDAPSRRLNHDYTHFGAL